MSAKTESTITALKLRASNPIVLLESEIKNYFQAILLKIRLQIVSKLNKIH